MVYNPITLCILAAWIYSGVCALGFLKKRAEKFGDRLPWYNLAALFFGPVVLLIVYLSEEFSGPFEKLVAALRIQRRAPAAALEFFTPDGQPLFSQREIDGMGPGFLVARQLLFDAITRSAGEIYIDLRAQGGAQVRFRLKGELKNRPELNENVASAVVGVLKRAAGVDEREHQLPQDGVFSAGSPKGAARFQFSSVGVVGGEKIAIRVRPQRIAGPLKLSELGLAPEQEKLLRSLLEKPAGLILLTGPEKSGISSTFYALMTACDTARRNVVSVESRPGRVVEGVTQLQVDPRNGIPMAELIGNALHQNPDLLFLSEIGDAESAKEMMHAAQSGRLVIAQMAAASIPEAISRLLFWGISPAALANTLLLATAQRLIRRLCNCARPVQLPADYRNYFEQTNLAASGVRGPAGCRECDGAGYDGQAAFFDLMEGDASFRSLFGNPDRTPAELRSALEESHGQSMLAYHGFQLVAAGITSLEEIQNATLVQQ